MHTCKQRGRQVHTKELHVSTIYVRWNLFQSTFKGQNWKLKFMHNSLQVHPFVHLRMCAYSTTLIAKMLVDFLKCKISWRAHRPWFPNLKFVDSTNHSTLFLLPSVHLRWAQVQRNWQRFGMLLISWVFTKNWFWEVFLSLCSNVLYVIMLVVNVVPPERLKVIDLWWGMVAEIYKLEQSSRHGWMWWIWQAEVHLGDDLTDSGCLSRFFIPVRLMRCSVPGVAWWERTGRPG